MWHVYPWVFPTHLRFLHGCKVGIQKGCYWCSHEFDQHLLLVSSVLLHDPHFASGGFSTFERTKSFCPCWPPPLDLQTSRFWPPAATRGNCQEQCEHQAQTPLAITAYPYSKNLKHEILNFFTNIIHPATNKVVPQFEMTNLVNERYRKI